MPKEHSILNGLCRLCEGLMFGRAIHLFILVRVRGNFVKKMKHLKDIQEL